MTPGLPPPLFFARREEVLAHLLVGRPEGHLFAPGVADGQPGRREVGIPVRDRRADVGEAGHGVHVERDAEFRREAAHQVVLGTLGTVGAEVVRGGAVTRDHAQLPERQDLLERGRWPLAGGQQDTGEGAGGDFERACAGRHA